MSISYEMPKLYYEVRGLGDVVGFEYGYEDYEQMKFKNEIERVLKGSIDFKPKFNTLWFEPMTELEKLSNKISKVVFNEPATIIIWKDGSKTVVKTQGDEVFDKEKGFLMAIAKKLADNKGNYNNIVKKWCE